MVTKYVTFKKNVVLKAGQVVKFLKGKGYYAATVVTKLKPLSPSERILQTALSQLGTKESPSGSNHTKYGVWYGVDHQPWCAIFVSWCCNNTDPKYRLPFKESYVPDIVNLGRSHTYGCSTTAVPAAVTNGVVLACYDWQKDGVADHVGFYVTEALLNRLVPKALAAAKAQFGPLGATDFWAVEGNTSVGNDSNGGEVLLRKRSVGDVQAFVVVT